jgi:hypothetical protein
MDKRNTDIEQTRQELIDSALLKNVSGGGDTYDGGGNGTSKCCSNGWTETCGNRSGDWCGNS